MTPHGLANSLTKTTRRFQTEKHQLRSHLEMILDDPDERWRCFANEGGLNRAYRYDTFVEYWAAWGRGLKLDDLQNVFRDDPHILERIAQESKRKYRPQCRDTGIAT